MKFFTATFLLLSCTILSAQDINVTGSWYGIGYVDMEGDHNSYLSELKLVQKGKKVTGEFNYYYRSDEIKTTISGKYDSATRTLVLNAAPILAYQAKNVNGADCPMTGEFVLLVAKMETLLQGKFEPTYAYRLTCPAISIKFKKELPPTSPPPPPPPFKNPPIVVKPRPKYTPIKKADTATTHVDTAELALKTVSLPPAAPIKKEPTPEEKAERNLKRRSFEAPPVIEVEADSLRISLYDNGEIDNDTISLFYNRKLIAFKQMLDVKPINISLPLDTTVNEISMYAENLGKIPPNTAMAVIYAGDQRYELFLTSTFIKNAAVRFKRKVKHYDPKNIN